MYSIGLRVESAVEFLMKKQILSFTDNQLLKYFNYCKRKHKYGTAYITKCRLGFPREVIEEGELKSIDDCLKSKSKIYALPRAENVVRVNDYLIQAQL